jgi:hypothetical protein
MQVVFVEVDMDSEENVNAQQTLEVSAWVGGAGGAAMRGWIPVKE